MQFEASYKALLINNLTSAKTSKGNCKDDGAEALFSLRNFVIIAQNSENKEKVSTVTEIQNDEYVLFPDEESTRTGTGIENSLILIKLITGDLR